MTRALVASSIEKFLNRRSFFLFPPPASESEWWGGSTPKASGRGSKQIARHDVETPHPGLRFASAFPPTASRGEDQTERAESSGDPTGRFDCPTGPAKARA